MALQEHQPPLCGIAADGGAWQANTWFKGGGGRDGACLIAQVLPDRPGKGWAACKLLAQAVDLPSMSAAMAAPAHATAGLLRTRPSCEVGSAIGKAMRTLC